MYVCPKWWLMVLKALLFLKGALKVQSVQCDKKPVQKNYKELRRKNWFLGQKRYLYAVNSKTGGTILMCGLNNANYCLQLYSYLQSMLPQPLKSRPNKYNPELQPWDSSVCKYTWIHQECFSVQMCDFLLPIHLNGLQSYLLTCLFIIRAQFGSPWGVHMILRLQRLRGYNRQAVLEKGK